jgi:hypothetical protein
MLEILNLSGKNKFSGVQHLLVLIYVNVKESKKKGL